MTPYAMVSDGAEDKLAAVKRVMEYWLEDGESLLAVYENGRPETAAFGQRVCVQFPASARNLLQVGVSCAPGQHMSDYKLIGVTNSAEEGLALWADGYVD